LDVDGQDRGTLEDLHLTGGVADGEDEGAIADAAKVLGLPRSLSRGSVRAPRPSLDALAPRDLGPFLARALRRGVSSGRLSTMSSPWDRARPRSIAVESRCQRAVRIRETA
jgi:hypothetical protein